MGVVVDKFPPKESAKGNKYTVWKLSDLSSQSAVVTLFLFGKAYQEHWKMVQGSVIALLNPTIMPNREVYIILFSHTHTHTVNELYNTHVQMFPRRTETAALLQ